MKTEKRGQITVFIIVGIILLLSAAIFLAITREIALMKPETALPQEIRPIGVYIESCLENKAEPAILLLGLQGGYIELPEDIRADPDKHLSIFPKMPDSRKIPYWYYDGKSRIPSRKSMEDQLNEYMKKELPDCINLGSFSNSFDIKEMGEMMPKATINRDSVKIELEYPLEIKQKGAEKITKANKFIAEIPIRLGRMHELATLIMEEENANKFLEELTIDMVATANTDNGRFPYEGSEITCSSRVWSISKQLKPDLQKMIKYNFHFLKFLRTKTTTIQEGVYKEENIDLARELNNYYYTQRERPDYQLPDGEYPQKSEYKINYLVDVGESYPDIEVSTFYNDAFGMKMDVYPSKGDIVEAMEMKIPLVGSCIKLYHHFYTIEYPMLFILTDLKDPERPFVFNFATPVIINKNQPQRAKDPNVINDDFMAITSDSYCQREDAMIELQATDAYTGEFIGNIEVGYQCMSFVCNKGSIKKEVFQGIEVGSPRLTTYFPLCINGLLTAKKNGYLDFSETLSVGDRENPAPSNLVIEMTPIKKLDYEFKVVEIENNVIKTVRAPNEDETVFLSLKSDDYETSIVYPTDVEQYLNLNLINMDKEYDLSIKLMKDDQVIGGYEILGWKVMRKEMVSANKVVFYVLLKKPIPKDAEEMGKTWVYFIQKESKSNLFKPKIK